MVTNHADTNYLSSEVFIVVQWLEYNINISISTSL